MPVQPIQQIGHELLAFRLTEQLVIQAVVEPYRLVARPSPDEGINDLPGVSVIVPARNEAGNIADIISRVPEMGVGTELIFVEGHSSDNTYEVIEKAIQDNKNSRIKLFRQPGKGKGDAVRLGFDQASEDVLMILDADLTVPPEYLPRFFDALISSKGEFMFFRTWSSFSA